ncbi:acylneuraminate cytidylyltransferase family protein [Flavobacteriaceae bacterium]|nr:acylneuraminate cytidylyltransferase family protein [Flavobacteriaceae bacterium]
MNILITICARGGSKGIPKKNILKLGNHPLIYYSIKIAQEFLVNRKGKIALSTDCNEIKKVASFYGLDSNYIRSEKLSNDKAGKISAIKDILKFQEKELNEKFDVILDLDVTSPLRTLNDLNSALEILLSDANANNLISVSPANRNPYFNMVEKRGSYFFKVKDIHNFKSRQVAPEVFDLNASFYFYNRGFFDQNNDSVFTDKTLVYNVPHLCFDIDEPIDLEFMSFLLEKNKLKSII